MSEIAAPPVRHPSQDELYQSAAGAYGAALDRLARGYEADANQRRDLLQDIHLAIWRSFANFDGRCSQRTWIYRVAHNTATSYILRQRRVNSRTVVGLDEIGDLASVPPTEPSDRQRALERLFALIQQLRPADRQVMLSYLEGLDAAAIGEITGLSARNVATKIHRIKVILKDRFHHGGLHVQ